MKQPAGSAAPADAKQERQTPAFTARLQFIGQQCNDYTLHAPEAMELKDLTDPAAWSLAKQVLGGPTLNVGDSVRVIHPRWFATCIVDRGGRDEACRVLVTSSIARASYAASERGLIPADHDVVQDPVTGYHLAVFFRGKDRERVELGEYSDFQKAAEACRDHASRTAPQAPRG